MANKKQLKSKVDTKILYEESIFLNGKTFNIKFTTEKKKNDIEGLLFGQTQFDKPTIFIFTKNIKAWNMSLKDVLYHEIGHAWMFTMPSHMVLNDYNDTAAESFEMASRLSPIINKIIANYKKAIKPVKKKVAKKTPKKKTTTKGGK